MLKMKKERINKLSSEVNDRNRVLTICFSIGIDVIVLSGLKNRKILFENRLINNIMMMVEVKSFRKNTECLLCFQHME